MSEATTEAVWSASRSCRGSRLVLLALAREADDQGTASLSLEEIARLTRLTVRGISKCLKELTALGELRHTTGGGTRNPNRYSILLLRSDTEDVESGNSLPASAEKSHDPGTGNHERTSMSENPVPESWNQGDQELEPHSSRTVGSNTPYGSITTSEQAGLPASDPASKRLDASSVDVPESAREVVAALEQAGLVVGWRLSASEWDRVTALSARWGAERLVEVIARRWDPARPPRSARYLLRIWDDLPSHVPASEAKDNVVPLRRESGRWAPYRNTTPPSAYENGF